MLYNKAETPYFKAARRIKALAERILPELNNYANNHARESAVALADPPQSFQRPLIGDLEPSLRMLDLLFNAEHIQRDSRIVIDKPPLDSLFSFEFAVVKPLPTPPPAPPPKPKRDRRADRERAKERRALASSAPKTRRSRATVGLAATESAPIETVDAAPVAELPAGPAADSATTISPEYIVVDIDGDSEPPTKRRRRGSKRAPFVLPGQSEIPPVVDDVDSHKSFSMFDEGWILPDGHRRHNRTARPASERSPELKRKTMHAGVSIVAYSTYECCVLMTNSPRSTCTS
jgi:hypothetical protein